MWTPAELANAVPLRERAYHIDARTPTRDLTHPEVVQAAELFYRPHAAAVEAMVVEDPGPPCARAPRSPSLRCQDRPDLSTLPHKGTIPHSL